MLDIALQISRSLCPPRPRQTTRRAKKPTPIYSIAFRCGDTHRFYRSEQESKHHRPGSRVESPRSPNCTAFDLRFWRAQVARRKFLVRTGLKTSARAQAEELPDVVIRRGHLHSVTNL